MNLSDFLKLWRVEKASTQLAQMPPNFYAEAQSLTQGKDRYESKKAQGIYNDLVHMRQHKMLMGCLRELQGGDRPQNLLANEKAVYKRIFEELGSMRSADLQFVDETVVEENEDEAQEKLSELEKGELKGSTEAAEEPEPPQDEAPEEPKEAPAAKPEKEKPEGKVPEEGPKAEEPAPGKDSPKGHEAPEEPEPGKAEEPVEGEPEAEEGPEKEREEEPKKGEKPKEEPKEVFKDETENKARMRVRFVKSMPAFVGPDLETLGPFEEDQVTELDAEIAEILLNNDAVELV